MSEYKITSANIKDWAKNYKGPLFDGILCDPPYELGFMGKSWDSSGIAFDVDMWKDLLRILKPGGHLLAFSGSRTYHRMAVAIEDAGFEIRDMIEYVYGSGFPKSLNIGKSVEAFVTTGNASKNGFHKLDGERRDGRIGMYDTVEEQGFRVKNPDQLGAYDLDPTTDEAKQWNGYGTALKPAHEPICMARKPLDSSSICENCEGRGDVNIGAKECWVCNGTGKIKSKKLSVAENVLKYGTGGLNIDGTRVGTEQRENQPASSLGNSKTMDGGKANPNQQSSIATGRFPANLIHDGSDEVEAVFPQTKAGVAVRRNKGIVASKNVTFNANDPTNTEDVGYGDSGSASRYFYTAKASRAERSKGLDSTVSIRVQLEICENNITRQENLAQLQVVMDNSHLKATAESGIGTKSGTEWSMSLFGNQYTEKYPINTKSTTKTTTSSTTTSVILNWLTGLLTNESTLGVNLEMASGGNPVKSAESSNTLIATINDQTALALGVNPAQANKRLLISVSDGKNFHSTVKPLSLTKYLATLIKPPTGGRLLVPFSGSGSEMIGALQAGWGYVEGVELTEEYIPIAEARIKYWLSRVEEEDKQEVLL